MPISASRVAAQMGGKKVFGRSLTTYNALLKRINEGLPESALVATVALFPEVERQRIRRTFTVSPNRRVLPMAESERLARLARTVALAFDVYDGDSDGAMSFLLTPNRHLEKQKPLDFATSEIGARQVEDLLLKIAYGFPS